MDRNEQQRVERVRDRRSWRKEEGSGCNIGEMVEEYWSTSGQIHSAEIGIIKIQDRSLCTRSYLSQGFKGSKVRHSSSLTYIIHIVSSRLRRYRHRLILLRRPLTLHTVHKIETQKTNQRFSESTQGIQSYRTIWGIML